MIQKQAVFGESDAAPKFLDATVVYLKPGEWMLDIEDMKPANSSIQEGVKLLSVTLAQAILNHSQKSYF